MRCFCPSGLRGDVYDVGCCVCRCQGEGSTPQRTPIRELQLSFKDKRPRVGCLGGDTGRCAECSSPPPPGASCVCLFCCLRNLNLKCIVRLVGRAFPVLACVHLHAVLCTLFCQRVTPPPPHTQPSESAGQENLMREIRFRGVSPFRIHLIPRAPHKQQFVQWCGP